MFISKSEFKSIIIPEILERLTNQDNTVLETIIEESIDEMKGFLAAASYDLTAFDATEENRNKTLLKHLKRICIYELYKRKDHPIDEDTQNAYDETMIWLEKVAIGKTSIFGGPKQDTSPEHGGDFIKFGSNNAYQSIF